MRALATFLLLAITGFAVADVYIDGGVRISTKLPASEAKTLIATLVRVGPITCKDVRVQRKGGPPGMPLKYDVWKIAADFADDPPLLDEDAVLVPRHVFPCIDSDELHAFLKRYLEEKKKGGSAPKDWKKLAEEARK